MLKLLHQHGFGLMNLNIGAGTVVSGDFTTIDWSADTYFIKIEMDITGGTTYEEYGTSHWNSPNTGATNESSFTALPGGNCSHGGTFHHVGLDGNWWSSTEYSATYAWSRILHYSNASIYRNNSNKKRGFSVRCLRD